MAKVTTSEKPYKSPYTEWLEEQAERGEICALCLGLKVVRDPEEFGKLLPCECTYGSVL